MNDYGEPNDVPGACNARLYISDNFGDNHATMRCGLAQDHAGEHEETWERPQAAGRVIVRWEHDEGKSAAGDES